jgi:Ca-activated chloride channel family protein
MPAARLAWVRHLPALLFASGLPFALMALADPYSSLVAAETTYPGRRIALMLDASDSMRTAFAAESLNRGTQQAFFTTIAAARRFVELRRQGRYRDLMALIEFGNRAYVITPFTTDYDNLLLSIDLIGDPVEFSMFPDPGTVIGAAVEQSVAIFKAFEFLDSAGNVMVIFTDGEDTNAQSKQKTLDEILQDARNARVPVYLVRTNYAHGEGQIIPDELWRPAVARTGGKFYAASDEASLLAAIEDIDRVSAGTIQVKQYASQEPRFAAFALIAAVLWTAAAALKLGTPYVNKIW